MWETKRPAKGGAAWRNGRRGLVVWVERSRHDPTRSLTVIAAVGLVVAAGLAVFGMPPVNLHSPTHFAGMMDPLCGMTRGAAATMRADLREAWWYNPASPLVVAAGFALVVRWAVGRSTGWWVGVRLHATPLVVAAAGVMVVALEANQQLHVARLR